MVGQLLILLYCHSIGPEHVKKMLTVAMLEQFFVASKRLYHTVQYQTYIRFKKKLMS